MNLKKYLKVLSVTMILLVFTSCSALHTAISKRNLDVQTKMSDTIWLNPVAPAQKTLFLQVKNSSDKNIAIEEKIKEKLQEKGYILVNNPDTAKFWLQANILKADKVDLRETSFDDFSGAVLAGGVGAVLGAQRSGGATTAVGWGLAASTVATIADALVKDIAYAVVTDVLITEKTGKMVNYSTNNQEKWLITQLIIE